MRKQVLLIIMMLSTMGLWAQESDMNLGTDFNAIWEFFLPGIIGAALALFSDAKKYMGSGIWDWGVFLKSKILPFVLSLVLGIVIYILMAFAPFSKPFIEILAGYEFTEISAASFFAAAAAIIDGFIKPIVDPRDPSEINMRYNQPLRRGDLRRKDLDDDYRDDNF